MFYKPLLKTSLALILLTLALSVGVHAQKKKDCSATTDADIVKAIYDQMKKKYDDQIIHINVRSKDGVVTIEGWTTTDKIKAKIGEIARKVKCVKQVNNTLTTSISGGCTIGQKKCGAICIPEEETCNICLTKTCQ